MIKHIALTISDKELSFLTDHLGNYIETAEAFRICFLTEEDLTEVTELNEWGYRSFSKSAFGLTKFVNNSNTVTLVDAGRTKAFVYKANVTGYSLRKIAKDEENFAHSLSLKLEDEILVIDPELIVDVKLLAEFSLEKHFQQLISFIEKIDK